MQMLDTLANVKTGLLISGTVDDTLLTRLMDGAVGFIADYTGRDFAGGTFTETHAAGRDVIFLRNFPISSVTSVKADTARQFGPDTLRSATSYVLQAEYGVIESLTGPFLPPRGGVRDDWPAAVQVVYATATGAVPAAVREAFTQLVGHWYRQVKSFANQDYQMIERGTDGKWWPWSLATGMKLPPTVLALLAPYRVPAA